MNVKKMCAKTIHSTTALIYPEHTHALALSQILMTKRSLPLIITYIYFHAQK